MSNGPYRTSNAPPKTTDDSIKLLEYCKVLNNCVARIYYCDNNGGKFTKDVAFTHASHNSNDTIYHRHPWLNDGVYYAESAIEEAFKKGYFKTPNLEFIPWRRINRIEIVNIVNEEVRFTYKFEDLSGNSLNKRKT